MSARGVFLLSSTPETRAAVSQALAGDRGVEIEGTCTDLHEMTVQLRRTNPAAVIVDIEPEPHRMLAALDPVIQRFRDTRFLVVANSTPPELLMEAMRVGVRQAIARPALDAELSAALHRLMPNGSAKGAGLGQAISIIPAGGGTGATVLAVNLANELRLLADSPTMLVDLDLAYGPTRRLLGLDGGFGIGDVLTNGTRIDADLIRSAATVFDSSLHVLASPAMSGVLSEFVPDIEDMARLVGACKSAFPYTVIDSPRAGIGLADRLSRGSALTLVPFQLTVTGVSCARAIVRELCARGSIADHVIPVAMRYAKRTALVDLEEARKAIGHPHFGQVPNDFRAATESVNFGKPLAQSAPRSPLRKEILRLAEHIHNASSAGDPVTPPW